MPTTKTAAKGTRFDAHGVAWVVTAVRTGNVYATPAEAWELGVRRSITNWPLDSWLAGRY